MTGEDEVLATPNGRRAFLDCYSPLIRMVRNLTVALPVSSPSMTEIRATGEIPSFGQPARIQDPRGVKYRDFDAILSVGSVGRPDLPWTVVNSNGWAARVASRGQCISSECSCSNPVGALGAACLGAAEVFKRLVRLKPERGQLHDVLNFSFYSYEAERPSGSAPAGVDFAGPAPRRHGCYWKRH